MRNFENELYLIVKNYLGDFWKARYVRSLFNRSNEDEITFVKHIGRPYGQPELNEGERMIPEEVLIDLGECFYIYNNPYISTKNQPEELKDIVEIKIPRIFADYEVNNLDNLLYADMKNDEDVMGIYCKVSKDVLDKVAHKGGWIETAIPEGISKGLLKLSDQHVVFIDRDGKTVFITESKRLLKDKINTEDYEGIYILGNTGRATTDGKVLVLL